MFSSKTFVIVIPNSLIHFELIFAYGINLQINLIHMHMDIWFLQHLFKSPFSPLNGCHSCQKSVDCLFLGSLFYSIGLYVYLYASAIFFWLLLLCNKF